MKRHILVTGGLGYIGSHTTVELINAGYSPVIIDNLSNSSIEALDGIEQITGIRPDFYQEDLADMSKLRECLSKYDDIDAVIHFAAFKAVGESVSIPEKYYRNNLTTLLNILDCMEEFHIPSIVFSSSCTVYGQPDVLPVTEKTPQKKASSPYGNTKRICEEIIQDSIHAHPDLRGIALRYFNPVGAHASALIGELPNGIPNNLMPFITQTGIGLRSQLKVFGNDYNTPDGSCIRDYIHVVDLAKAHVVAIDRMIEGRQKEHYEVFNIGTGNGISVLEMVEAFQRVTGKALPHCIVGRREGDIEKIWADPTLANEELGWKAELSLDEMMSSAWKWENYYNSRHPSRE